MLFVTLHGGKPGAHPLRNNIHAYDKNGVRLTTSVLDDEPGITLSELRSIRFAGNFLYVANANKTQNSVLCYEGANTSYTFVSEFVSHSTCKGIAHPFDFVFDGAGHCYVASQDTNVITRLIVSKHGTVGTPAPLAPALPAKGTFLPGTFVASSAANLCGLTTTAVPSPLGLEYSSEGAKKHSVRGIAWVNDALYVVDQPAGRVKIYNPDGRLVGQSNQVKTPVHITVHKGALYVTGANKVFTAAVPKPAGDFTLSAIPGLRVQNGCGMAFTKQGNVYIGSRTENFVLKFDANFQPLEFQCELPDNPEFLIHV